MKVIELEQYIGDLKANPEYKLDVSELVTALAILDAYKKGLQGQYLHPEDLLTNTEYAEERLKRLTTPFHSMLGQIFSMNKFGWETADKILQEFYSFNKKYD